MNTILLILRRLQLEVDRVSTLDVPAFRAYIGDIEPHNLARLWRTIDDSRFRRKLSEDIDVSIVSNALEMLPYELKAELLKYMSNRLLLRVERTWSAEKQLDELNRLENWQDMEDGNWENRIADTRVMTGELPRYYPPAMKECFFCRRCYSYWQSICILDCQRHSLCETHDTEEGYCNTCHLQS